MKTQAARWLLALGLASGIAGAASAGPFTSPTPTPTPTVQTEPTPTPTPTLAPTPTATAEPATPTPTPTPQPGDLSGLYEFVDKKNFDRSRVTLRVDTTGNEVCLAGLVQAVDPTTTLNRRVAFEYRSVGVITKATAKTVNATFNSVELSLRIEELSDPTVTEYTGTTATGCTLKGKLKKEGDAVNAKLKCDLGENLANFAPVLTEVFLENIRDAFDKRKNLKVDTKKGKIRFNHNGEPAPAGLGGFPACDF